jgi:phosphohistidine phosphatase
MDMLYLLRHGIAVEPGSADFADDERPLTPKGRRRVRQVAFGLEVLKIKPDRIVSSPLPRARQTAEIVADVLKMPERLEFDDALRAGVEAASVIDWIRGRPDGTLMVVGHNPWISEAVERLTAGAAVPEFVELRKAGIAALAARADGRFSLEWLARPKLLRKLGE